MFVLHFLLPLLALWALRYWGLFKNPMCEKMNIPLLPDPATMSNWELCEKIEYLDSLLGDILACMKHTVICSMAVILLDSVICFVSRRTTVERKARKPYIVLASSLIGIFILIQGMVFRKITVTSISSFALKMAASLFSEIKFVPKRQINPKVPDCFLMFIDKVILFTPFLVAIETGTQMKRIWVHCCSNKNREINTKQIRRAHLRNRRLKPLPRQTDMQSSLIPANSAVKPWSRNCYAIAYRNRLQQSDYPMMLANVIWKMSATDTTKQVMLQCADVIDTHLLNDSEATLLRWLCLCTTSALFRAKGDIQGIVTNSSSQLRKLTKLGSMLSLQTQTFNGMRLISNLQMLDYRHNDIIFDIKLDRGFLVLKADVLHSRKKVSGCHKNCLKLSAKFLPPLQPRIQRRLAKYNVISISGSAQKVNEALKEFERRTIRLIYNPFVRQDVVGLCVKQVKGFHLSNEQLFRKKSQITKLKELSF